MPRIAIIYYSMYGHIHKLAVAAKRGIESVQGCEGVLLQVAETLSDEILAKMHAPGKSDDPIVDPFSIAEYDGFLFGTPTRFGMPCAQMKAFWDTTGSLWAKGSLIGKPAGVFVSVSTQGGGMELTGFTMISQFAHHGMIYLPTGYGYGFDKLSSFAQVRGGSPWGSGTFAGADNKREPTETELGYAEYQGKYTAEITAKLTAANKQ